MIRAALLAAALPLHGVVVPGASLGGLQLGATPRAVTATWGRAHGVCENCRHQTWYFNYAQFQPQGAGVEFRRGRAVALFTLWSPTAWRTRNGLRIGDASQRIRQLYGNVTRASCGSYSVFTLRRRTTATDFYVVDNKVWGFGLRRVAVPPCR